MFGGLTHEGAVRLGERLCEVAPEGLERVFLADSGSVSVEVAIKLCLQFQRAQGRPARTRLLTVRGGYHGDTAGAMALCDPVGGMHSLFTGLLARHVFAERPPDGFDAGLDEAWAGDVGGSWSATPTSSAGIDGGARRAGGRRHALPLAGVREVPAGAVRRARPAAGARRDRHRLRAHRDAVRKRTRARVRRRDVCRQGAHRGLHDDGRDAVYGGGRGGGVGRRGRGPDARPDLHGQPARLRGLARLAGAARRRRLAGAGGGRSSGLCAAGWSRRASSRRSTT